MLLKDSGYIHVVLQEAPEPERPPEDVDILSEEQKKELGELQLFKNKEGNVSIEVGVHAAWQPGGRGTEPKMNGNPMFRTSHDLAHVG